MYVQNVVCDPFIYTHMHTYTHTHTHTHTIKVNKKCYTCILQGGHEWIGAIFFKKKLGI